MPNQTDTQEQKPLAAEQAQAAAQVAVPLRNRILALIAGLAGCCAFQIISGAILSNSGSRYAGKWILMLLIGLPKLLRALVATGARDIVNLTIWPWLIMLVIGLIAHWFPLFSLTMAYGAAILLGCAGVFLQKKTGA